MDRVFDSRMKIPINDVGNVHRELGLVLFVSSLLLLELKVPKEN